MKDFSNEEGRSVVFSSAGLYWSQQSRVMMGSLRCWNKYRPKVCYNPQYYQILCWIIWWCAVYFSCIRNSITTSNLCHISSKLFILWAKIWNWFNVDSRMGNKTNTLSLSKINVMKKNCHEKFPKLFMWDWPLKSQPCHQINQTPRRTIEKYTRKHLIISTYWNIGKVLKSISATRSTEES